MFDSNSGTTTMINSPNVYQTRPFGFSQAVVHDQLIFGSGQVGWDTKMQLSHPIDFDQQFDQTIQNITHLLKEGGSSWQDIIHLRFYIKDIDARKREYVGSFLKKTYQKEYAPASTMIGISALAREELLIEIEFTAKINIS